MIDFEAVLAVLITKVTLQKCSFKRGFARQLPIGFRCMRNSIGCAAVDS